MTHVTIELKYLAIGAAIPDDIDDYQLFIAVSDSPKFKEQYLIYTEDEPGVITIPTIAVKVEEIIDGIDRQQTEFDYATDVGDYDDVFHDWAEWFHQLWLSWGNSIHKALLTLNDNYCVSDIRVRSSAYVVPRSYASPPAQEDAD